MNDERDLLAAEYVLGTLHADERTLFMTVLVHDAEAREAVAAWERRLAPLAASADATPPSPEVWRRIDAALAFSAPLEAARGGQVDDDEEDEDESTPERAAFAALRRSLAAWRAAALGAGALAATLAGLALFREIARNPAVQPNYLAVVNRGGDLPALIVRIDLASSAIYVRPLAAQQPEGHSLELWYIGDGKAPKSMGVIGAGAERMPLPAGLSLQKATFAVTVEPAGGSPTGDPSGPPVYSGRLIQE